MSEPISRVRTYLRYNDILSRIRRALNTMLQDLQLGWQVIRANQPTIQALQNNTVYFDVISRRRYGVQGSRPKKNDDGDWQMEIIWYEEWLIQVSAFKQRDPEEDDEITTTASDVITLLQSTINANNDIGTYSSNWDVKNGRYNYFPSSRYSLIRSTDVREVEFETDSGLKEKFPQFDFLLVVEQRLLKKMEKIDTIELETKRI